MTATPEPIDPFSPDELQAIVSEALAEIRDNVEQLFPADDHPDAQEQDDDHLSLVCEVEHHESFALPPLRIRTVIQWPATLPQGVDPAVARYFRRRTIAKMANELAKKLNEGLDQELPLDGRNPR